MVWERDWVGWCEGEIEQRAVWVGEDAREE